MTVDWLRDVNPGGRRRDVRYGKGNHRVPARRKAICARLHSEYPLRENSAIPILRPGNFPADVVFKTKIERTRGAKMSSCRTMGRRVSRKRTFNTAGDAAIDPPAGWH